MTVHRNRYHTLWFDPGYIATGWAWFIIDAKAFTHHSELVLSHILDWNTGEFRGSFVEQCQQAIGLMQAIRFGDMPYTPRCDIGSEGFRLSQLQGGEELYAPLRITAVLDWYCQQYLGTSLVIQDRSIRTNVTKQRLHAWGLASSGKDSFAAMQHAIVWLRRLKKKANHISWTLDT